MGYGGLMGRREHPVLSADLGVMEGRERDKKGLKVSFLYAVDVQSSNIAEKRKLKEKQHPH